MENADGVFNAAIILGLVLLFIVFVERATFYLLPKRINFGCGALPAILGLILAIGLLIFGLGRLATSVEQTEGGVNAGAVGQIASVVLVGGFVLFSVLAFVYKKLGAWGITAMVVSFFAAGIFTNLMLRSVLVEDALNDDDLFFISVAVSTVVTGIGAIAARWLLADTSAERLKPRTTPDPLSFGEKRRKRLGKKRQ